MNVSVFFEKSARIFTLAVFTAMALCSPAFAQWQQVGAAGFSASEATYISLALDSSNTPYVAYMDYAKSHKASVMRFDGTSWVQVGAAGFSAGSAPYASLALDSIGTPYVAYQDYGNSNKASVMKFDGASWVQVGAAGLSAGSAFYTSLAFDSSGTPYVAYQDYGNSNKVSVMKFDGSSWVYVGTAGFSAGEALNTSLALDSNNTPYVAYRDGANINKASMMRFDGTSWVQVGAAGFSAGWASYTRLALDSSNTPYVAYQDSGSSNKASVMKYNGTSWVQVGVAGFSIGVAGYTSLALDSSSTPYVAYRDDANASKASVMKFEGSSWVQVGAAGFSPGEATYISLALDSSNTPYVAYRDNANGGKVSVMKYLTVSGGIITTIAGTGTAGYSGDGGTATAAQLTSPNGVYADSSGNIFITDYQRIRMVDISGNISTVAGTETGSYSGDGGPATSAQLNSPTGLYVDSSGNIFVADRYNHCIRRFTVGGNISTVAGTGTGGYNGDGIAATSAQLFYPTSVYGDSSGNIFIADRYNHRIRRFTVGGNISTVAGTGTQGYSGDDGPATAAQLSFPDGVYADSSGNIFVADRDNYRIRQFTVGGNITTVAGDGTAGYSGDGGPATAAQLNSPYSVYGDSFGNLFIADYFNHCIRRFTVGGNISTFAGTGTAGYSGDGGPATSAQLNQPFGLYADISGNLFIADMNNNRIRKVTNPLARFAVTGAVKLQSGVAVRDIKVVADNLDTGSHVSAKTNSDGIYRMTGLLPGTWKIRVAQEENVSQYVNPEPKTVSFADADTVTTAGGINFELAAPSFSLSVSVLSPDNQPIRENCSVEAVNAETGRAFSDFTDEGDGFYIALPASGLYKVSLWINPDKYPSYNVPAIEPVNITGNQAISVVLENRSAVVSGTIRSSAGTLLSGISVTACQPDGRLFQSKTGADGDYSLNLPAGTWTLKPADESQAYLFAAPAQEMTLTPAGSQTLSFEMEPVAAEITGEVRDEAGIDAISGATVGWIYARRKTGTDWRILSQTAVSARAFSLKVPAIATVTDYVFSLAADTAYTLETTEIQPDAQNKIVIQLKKNSAVVKGKLTDSAGNAVAGVGGTIFVTPPDRKNSAQSSKIDPKTGMFELLLSEGKWNLSYEILTDQYASAPLSPIEVNAVSGENPLNIVLIPLLGKISGKVTAPDGNPMPNIQVRVRQYLETGMFEKMLFSDSLGAFSCFVPSAETEAKVGTAVESVELPSAGGRQASKTAKAAPSKKSKPGKWTRENVAGYFELKLREADTLMTGKVVDKTTGKGLKGAFVYAYTKDGQKATAVADDAGVFRMDVARVSGTAEGSNLWFVSATWKPADGTGDYYTGSTRRIDISGVNYTVTVPDISLETSGTLSSAEIYEFSLSNGGDCLLGDKTGVEIPANVIPSNQSQKLKVTVEPQAQGLPESDEYQLVAYGYAIGMYSKETGRKFDSDLNKEIMLTLNYTDEQIAERGIIEAHIRPAYFLEASRSWQAIKSFTLDTVNNTVSFRTNHFSLWALVAPRIAGELDDAILALQVCAGYETAATASEEGDISGDGKIGLAEVIYILKNLSSF